MLFDGDEENDDRVDDNGEAAFDDGDDDDNDDGDDDGDGDDDDDDDDDVDEYAERQAEEMRRIESNDPTLTELVVGCFADEDEDEDFADFDYIVPGGDWECFGRAIGRNTTLKEVSFNTIGRDNIDRSTIHVECFQRFLPGFALNRSIQKLSFTTVSLNSEGIWNILIPFFASSEAFQCLVVKNCGCYRRSCPVMASAFRRFHSLKEFHLIDRWDDDDDEGADTVIDALIGHTGLMKLTLSVGEFKRKDFTALASLLQNPTSNLMTLALDMNAIDDERASVFATALATNTTLTELEIESCYTPRDGTEIGWQAIFSSLQRSACKLEKLYLLGCQYFNDAVTLSLSNALLRHNTTLKTLTLTFLGRSTTRTSTASITDAGWTAIFQLLRDPNSVLEKLSLFDNYFTDEAILALAIALANNSKLRELDLGHNHRVTPAGWVAFSAVLRHPNSALESLDLRRNAINDQVVISFAEALSTNNRLRELYFATGEINSVTSDGYVAMTRILCNNSSILSTFNSNHTLEILHCNCTPLPEDLRSLLLLNRKKNSSRAARLKIVKTHLSGHEINMQPFMDMNLSVRPHAIAWMAKNKRHFYRLLRAMPSLLEQVGSKKRSYKLVEHGVCMTPQG
jgi:Ran GTPase-activating protein (RanGAP) involved in mRNA processing and transport